MDDIDLDVSSAAPQTASPTTSDNGALSDPLSGKQLSDPLSGKGGKSGPPPKPNSSVSGKTNLKDPLVAKQVEQQNEKEKTLPPKEEQGGMKKSDTAKNEGPAPKPEGDQGGNGGQKENKDDKLKLLTKDKYSMELSVPLPVPGLSVDVSAEVEAGTKEGVKNLDPKEKTTTLSAKIKAGVSFSIAFFKLSLLAVGTMEAEVKGAESVTDALKKAVNEFTRWRLSDKVADVAGKLAKMDPLVDKRRAAIEKGFDELRGDISKGKNKKDIAETLTKESFIFSRSFYENLSKEGKGLAEDLKSAAGISSSDEAKSAADYFINMDSLLRAVKQLGAAANAGASHDDLMLGLNELRTKVHGAVDQAKGRAQGSIKALDFKVPTPGIKVAGTLGGEVKLGFSFGGGNKADLSVGAAMKFDTSKTKKEVNGSGEEREVFDKQWDKVVRLDASFEAGGFKGSIGLQWQFGSQKAVTGELELATPQLPLGITAKDLPETANVIKGFMKDGAADATKEVKETKKEAQQEGALTKIKKKLQAAMDKMKPYINALKYAKDKAQRVKDMQAGLTSIETGGSVEIAEGKVSGTAFLGLANGTELDMNVLGAGVKVGKVSSSRLELPWSG